MMRRNEGKVCVSEAFLSSLVCMEIDDTRREGNKERSRVCMKNRLDDVDGIEENCRSGS